MMNRRGSKNSMALVAVVVALAFVQCSQYARGEDKQQPLNARLTSEAWESLTAGDHASTIKKVGECIKEFYRDAENMQKDLKAQNVPLPPTGHVDDAAKKKEILSRGPLNDVATCYFIQGKTYLKMAESSPAEKDKREKMAKAKQAFEAAGRFTYARTYDPNGDPNNDFFWDPAKRSGEIIEDTFGPKGQQ
jgi:hypothetical protein